MPHHTDKKQLLAALHRKLSKKVVGLLKGNSWWPVQTVAAHIKATDADHRVDLEDKPAGARGPTGRAGPTFPCSTPALYEG